LVDSDVHKSRHFFHSLTRLSSIPPTETKHLHLQKPNFFHSVPSGTLRKKRPYRKTSASFPLAISSASRAKSWYITRSFSIVAHTDRIAACAACPRFEVFSGFAACI